MNYELPVPARLEAAWPRDREGAKCGAAESVRNGLRPTDSRHLSACMWGVHVLEAAWPRLAAEDAKE